MSVLVSGSIMEGGERLGKIGEEREGKEGGREGERRKVGDRSERRVQERGGGKERERKMVRRWEIEISSPLRTHEH